MQKKTVSGLLLALLLLGMSASVFDVQQVRAGGTIYIRPDGTVDGTDKIQRDGDVYTFTDSIYDTNGIAVFRDNIVVDGAGYTLHGTGSGTGILLISRSHVIIKNVEIEAFENGIWLDGSSYNTICGNDIKNNARGIEIVFYSRYNSIYENNLTNNIDHIELCYSSYSNVCRNNIENGSRGIELFSTNNISIYHNNFINNTNQVITDASSVWDDGYPSGGNYWSDHVEVDEYSGINQDELGSDGIVDVPYIIDDENRDHYPLVEPLSPVIPAIVDIAPDTLHLKSSGQWMTCFIELPEGYNVSDIDVSAVILNDTIPVSLLNMPAPDPVPTEIGDYDEDGIPDLMVKFNRTLVLAFILSKRTTSGVVTLTITGNVNGAPFEGADTIRVLMGGGGRRGHK